MKSKVIIGAQYFENYNVNAEGFNLEGDGKPYWKAKGGHEFVIEIDTDFLMYCDNLEQVFQKMLDKHESVAERFEYRNYKIQWQEPTVLGTEDDFLDAMRNLDTVDETL